MTVNAHTSGKDKTTLTSSATEDQTPCHSTVCGLRFKAISILATLFLVTMLLFLAILLSVSLTTFNNVEVNATVEATKRTSRAIYDHLDLILSRQRDYADWDSTYNVLVNYTDTAMQEWLDYNYYYEYTRDAHKVNYILVYFMDGNLAGYRGYNLTTGEELAIPFGLASLPTNHPILAGMNDTEAKKGGYIMLDSGAILLVTAYPIQNSIDETGTVGVLVYAKHVTNEFLDNISDRSQLCVTMYSSQQMNEPSIATYKRYFGRPDGTVITMTSSNWRNNQPFRVKPLDISSTSSVVGRSCWMDEGSKTSKSERIATYQMYADMFGESNIIIRSDVHRYVRRLGIRSFLISYGVVCCSLIIMSVVIILFVERSVLTPIVRLSHFVNQISIKNDISVRVPVKSKDEIGSLSKRVNTMLNALQNTQEKLKSEHKRLQQLLQKVALEEQKTKAIMQGISDFLFTVDAKTGVILNANNAFYAASHYSPNTTENSASIQQFFTEFEGDILEALEKIYLEGGLIETNLTTKMKRFIPVQVTANQIELISGDKVVTAYVILARNLSEKQELQQSHKQQIQLMQSEIKFDSMLRDKIERELFKEFTRKEVSEENMLFIEQVEVYRNTPEMHERSHLQQLIIDKFLKQGGEHLLNLSSEVLEKEMFEIEKGFGQRDLFDKLERVVREMIISDTFSRFSSHRNSLLKRQQN